MRTCLGYDNDSRQTGPLAVGSVPNGGEIEFAFSGTTRTRFDGQLIQAEVVRPV